MNVRTIVNQQNEVHDRLEVAVHMIRLLETERQELIEKNKTLSQAAQVCLDLGYIHCDICHVWDREYNMDHCANCKSTFCENCGRSCQICIEKMCNLCPESVRWFGQWCQTCKLNLKCWGCKIRFNDNFRLGDLWFDITCDKCDV